jgi:hypothetical protein
MLSPEPGSWLSAFVEHQRSAQLADLRGLGLEAKIPLPLAEANRLIAGALGPNAFVDEVKVGCERPNRLSIDIRSRGRIFDFPGLGWVLRGVLGFDLTPDRLRLDLEIVPGTFQWPQSPFIILRLSSSRSASVLGMLVKTTGLWARLLGDWAEAVILEGQEVVFDLRWMLERTGWACIGPALQQLDISCEPGRFWLESKLLVGIPSCGTARVSSDQPQRADTKEDGSSPMKELFEKHLANGFADFAGLRVSGEIPLRESTLNELLNEFLDSARRPAEASSQGEEKGSSDVGGLLRRVKTAEVKIADDAVWLKFEVGVNG